jgi:hypothetical protein
MFFTFFNLINMVNTINNNYHHISFTFLPSTIMPLFFENLLKIFLKSKKFQKISCRYNNNLLETLYNW